MKNILTLSLTCLLSGMVVPAAAHHTYTHQMSGSLHLFSTKEIRFFVIDKDVGKACAYLIPRKKSKTHYGALISGKDCPKDVWLRINRNKKGVYSLAPVKGAKKPPRIRAKIKLTPVVGPNYDTWRSRFAIAGLMPRMTAQDTASMLEKHFGEKSRTVAVEVDMQNHRLEPKGFSALTGKRKDGEAEEEIIAITHEDGADGYYNSDPGSVVAVRQQISFSEIERVGEAEFLKRLTEKFGTPASVERELWPDSDKPRQIELRWAVNADGSNQVNIVRWKKCGDLPLANFRAFPNNEEGNRSSQWINMAAHDMFAGNDAILPGDCVLFVSARFGVTFPGRVHRLEITLTDAGLVTDIHNKTVFDAAGAMAKNIKIPKRP